ncbi:MAG: HIT family protein, partial [Moraxellaceae bacterium]|nr:HIT family protein [Moraxellaceae bacterium]
MSIFSQIMAGEIPANWVYQDALCVAFMDINPMSPGHVLVVPRLEVATLEELPGDLRTHLLDITVRVAAAQRQGLGSLAQHVLVNDGKAASQTVPH